VIDPSIVLLKMLDGVVAALVDPSNRTYLLYLVSAALAAGLILVRQLGLKTAYKQLALVG
jgi:hypothetical protein